MSHNAAVKFVTSSWWTEKPQKVPQQALLDLLPEWGMHWDFFQVLVCVLAAGHLWFFSAGKRLAKASWNH